MKRSVSEPVSGEEELVSGEDDSRASWAGTVASLDSSDSGYNSDEYWFSNKGCTGCSKLSFPNGMHPSQKYHLEGCLSDGFRTYKRRKVIGDGANGETSSPGGAEGAEGSEGPGDEWSEGGGEAEGAGGTGEPGEPGAEDGGTGEPGNEENKENEPLNL